MLRKVAGGPLTLRKNRFADLSARSGARPYWRHLAHEGRCAAFHNGAGAQVHLRESTMSTPMQKPGLDAHVAQADQVTLAAGSPRLVQTARPRARAKGGNGQRTVRSNTTASERSSEQSKAQVRNAPHSPRAGSSIECRGASRGDRSPCGPRRRAVLEPEQRGCRTADDRKPDQKDFARGCRRAACCCREGEEEEGGLEWRASAPAPPRLFRAAARKKRDRGA